MKPTHHEQPDVGSYVLSQDHYDDLRAIQAKLQLMAHLAGTDLSGHHNATLVIRRDLIGQLFRDLSGQINDVLNAITQTAAPIH